jgi:hypothetical protein
LGHVRTSFCPRKDSSSPSTGIRLYETLYEYRDNDAEMQRRLAYWLEGYWRANQAKIDKLGAWFFTAAVGLILQLVFWTWALAGTI